MGESNTVVSAYTMYRHLQQYCSHPSISAWIEICIRSQTALKNFQQLSFLHNSINYILHLTI